MAKAGGSTLGVVKVPVAALVGLGVGIFALLNVQGLASAFVGRVESGAGATRAAFVGSRLAGSASGMMAGRMLTTTSGNGGVRGGPGPTPPAAGRSSGAVGTPMPSPPTATPTPTAPSPRGAP